MRNFGFKDTMDPNGINEAIPLYCLSETFAVYHQRIAQMQPCSASGVASELCDLVAGALG
jgi:hypothetical protein